MYISFLGILVIFMEQNYLNMRINIHQVDNIMLKKYLKHPRSFKLVLTFSFTSFIIAFPFVLLILILIIIFMIVNDINS